MREFGPLGAPIAPNRPASDVDPAPHFTDRTLFAVVLQSAWIEKINFRTYPVRTAPVRTAISSARTAPA